MYCSDYYKLYDCLFVFLFICFNKFESHNQKKGLYCISTKKQGSNIKFLF